MKQFRLNGVIVNHQGGAENGLTLNSQILPHAGRREWFLFSILNVRVNIA